MALFFHAHNCPHHSFWLGLAGQTRATCLLWVQQEREIPCTDWELSRSIWHCEHIYKSTASPQLLHMYDPLHTRWVEHTDQSQNKTWLLILFWGHTPAVFLAVCAQGSCLAGLGDSLDFADHLHIRQMPNLLGLLNLGISHGEWIFSEGVFPSSSCPSCCMTCSAWLSSFNCL